MSESSRNSDFWSHSEPAGEFETTSDLREEAVVAAPAARRRELAIEIEAGVYGADLAAFLKDLKARNVISPMAALRPEVIYAFAAAMRDKTFGELPKAKRRLLARVGRCRYSCEVYLEAKAWLSGKKLVFVGAGGVPVGPAPSENGFSGR
ncbi:MAG TPA: hypothetical protein VG820_03380 [Fimbriimonadaceae bacterium]|nr:hypothetical protein [Fimbriimonadaceae bacterium]